MNPCKRLRNLETITAHMATREKVAMEDIAKLKERISYLEAKQ